MEKAMNRVSKKCSNNPYSLLNPTLLKNTPHIFEANNTRFCATIITKTKLNHRLWSAHLNKIEVKILPIY